MRSDFFLLIFVCITVAARADQASVNSDWNQFRQDYPYHIQTVALSAIHADGHRTLIVSEPPPHVSFEDIRAVSPTFSDARQGKHGIGVDGWVRDVVIDLPPIHDSDLTGEIDRLQHALFGTTYKAYAVSVPAPIDRKPITGLDLHVGSADLASWLLPSHLAVEEPQRTTLFGLIVALLLLIWGLQRVLSAKAVSGSLLISIAVVGMLTLSSSTTELILSLGLVLVSAILFRLKRPVLASAMACITSLFLGVGISSRPSADDAKTHFTPLLGGTEVSCETILQHGMSGVFLSRPAGLVAWSITKSKPIDGLSAQIRQFALDSDMIIGAVSRGDQVVIVGRERTSDVSLLPPLRAETVLLLASAKEDELKQSYERTVLMAGRAKDRNYGEQDWAPILLSPRLIDTEYGSLLNITDQLLKSWSQHGEVVYVNFRYPKPASYPFDKGLMEHLGVDQVTYNWNTKGAGYVNKTGPYEIFALNRTAALPIDYLAEGRADVQQAEDDAYNWYAGLSDPNLIRVVHYAALYQIFYHFGIHSEMSPPAVTQPFGVLEGPSEKFLRKIASLSDDSLTALAIMMNPKFIQQELRPARDLLKRAVDGDGPFTIQQIASVSCDRSKMSSVLEGATEDDAKALQSLLMNLFDLSDVLVPEEIKSQAMEQYVLADTQHPGVWIRTPTIVESKTKGGVGGHNLSAKVTLLEADSSVDAGKVIVRETSEGQKVIHYNPADDIRVGGAVREAARDDSRSASEIEDVINHKMPTERTAAVDPDQGLGFTNGIHPDPLRGLQVSHVDGGFTNFGWRPKSMAIADSDAKVLSQLKGRSNQVMMLTRSDSGTYIIGIDGGQSIEASDQASAIDGFLQLAGESPDKRVHLHTRGLDERQTRGFLSGTGRYTKDYDVVATREEDIDLDSLKAMMEDKYDLKKAKFGEVTVSDADEHGIRQLSQDIEIPPKVGGLKGFVLRIRIFFEHVGGDLQVAVDRITSQIQTYLENYSQERDLRFVGAELTKRLQQDGLYLDVRVEMRKENKVAFYADNFDSKAGGSTKGLAI